MICSNKAPSILFAKILKKRCEGAHIALELNGNGTGDTGVNNINRMSHDAPALHVPENIHHRAYRPLHHRRHRTCQKSHCGTYHLAPARVAPRPTLHAQHFPPT
ncbi:hypothetical protein IEQ34_006650 [Dendrobium chrysotoxum]|uniref:Uncharacterized protein n=1 Tax=Dendrobium chrysotoxum TaxID=161865 RepID=A0AAV7H884_DENCH|nr:hypothetical protein IEQ34_006650 [Dendrobium chrysotoxum]